MKLSLKTAQQDTVLPVNGGSFRLDEPFACLDIDLGPDETVSLQMGNDKKVLSVGISRVPLLLTPDFKCQIKLTFADIPHNFLFHFDPAGPVRQEIINDLVNLSVSLRSLNGKKEFTVEELLNAHKSGMIPLLCVKGPLTGFDDDRFQQRLSEDLSQKVRAICSHPKRGTKREELVQEVGLVKEINTNTLKHLSAHTEHWKARTLTSLIPKRLLSTVIEDDIDIYENLFFKMAIRDISAYVNDQIIYLRNAQRQCDQQTRIGQYADKVNDWQRKQIFADLLPKQSFSEAESLSWQYQTELTNWEKISRLLQTISGSSFFQQISKQKRIGRNVYLTNILRNDQRYKALYDLWISIRRKDEISETRSDIGKREHYNINFETYYTNYVFVLLIWCLCNKLKLKFRENEFITFNAKDELVVPAGLFAEDDAFYYQVDLSSDQYGQYKITMRYIEKTGGTVSVPRDCIPFVKQKLTDMKDLLTMSNDTIIFSRKPSENEKNAILRCVKGNKQMSDKWSHFMMGVFDSGQSFRIPRSFTQEYYTSVLPADKGPNAIDDIVNYLASSPVASSSDSSVFWLIQADIDDSKGDADNASRLVNYGDIPANQKRPPYSYGVLPIAQADIFSAQRIMKTITMRRALLLMEWEGTSPVHCPVCLSDNIHKLDRDTWECECGSRWGKTKCVAGCERFFDWIAPREEALKWLTKEDVNDTSELSRIIKRDLIFGTNIITDFEYEFQENNEKDSSIKLYPVCPYCGTKRSRT